MDVTLVAQIFNVLQLPLPSKLILIEAQALSSALSTRYVCAINEC